MNRNTISPDDTRFMLILPKTLHKELKKIAFKHEATMKDLIVTCLQQLVDTMKDK